MPSGLSRQPRGTRRRRLAPGPVRSSFRKSGRRGSGLGYKSLLQESPAAAGWKVRDLAEHDVALPLVGTQRLRIEGVDPGAVAATGDGFGLGCGEQPAGQALATQHLGNEQ